MTCRSSAVLMWRPRPTVTSCDWQCVICTCPRRTSLTMIVSPGSDDVGQLGLDFVVLAVRRCAGLDAAVGAAIGQPAGQRQHLQHRRARLRPRYAPGVFTWPADEHRLRLRDVDRVAVLQRDVQRRCCRACRSARSTRMISASASSPAWRSSRGAARTIIASRPAVGVVDRRARARPAASCRR